MRVHLEEERFRLRAAAGGGFGGTRVGNSGGMTRNLRYLAASLILISGNIHAILWIGGYEAIPTIGPLFVVNILASVALATALVIRPAGLFALGGIGFALTTVVSYGLTVTVGLFGFRDSELDGRSIGAAAAEIGTIILLGWWFRSTRPGPGQIAVLGIRQTASPATAGERAA